MHAEALPALSKLTWTPQSAASLRADGVAQTGLAALYRLGWAHVQSFGPMTVWCLTMTGYTARLGGYQPASNYGMPRA